VKPPRPPPTEYRQNELDGALANTLSLEELRKYFHLPIVEVARQLGTCTTALKKVCRRHKIQKWPYRQIRSLTKSIQSLEMAGMNDSITDELKQQYREQITTLQKAIDDIVFDPNTNISDLAKKLESEWGNPIHDEKWNSNSEPSESVKQLLQAAAAVSAEAIHSRPSQSTKRKFSQVEGEKIVNGLGENDTPVVVAEVASASPYPPQPPQAPIMKPPMEMVNIGVTQVSHVMITGSDTKNGSIHFVGPVVLAPLERRRISKQASKKLVPLIEPDICNHFKMEFLPQGTILEVKFIRAMSMNGGVDVGQQLAHAYDPSHGGYGHGGQE
jgi:hypothetical protein